jgi:TRAP transporter TAXI family solute receptor
MGSDASRLAHHGITCAPNRGTANGRGTSATFQPSSVTGGMIAIATGKADISAALPQVEVRAGIAGAPPFKEPLKGKIGAMLTMVDKLEFFSVADKGWADKYGIRTFADIAAKKPPVRLNLNTKGTFYAIEAARALLKQYGITLADIEKWGGTVVYSASRAQIQNFRDGKIDLIYNSSLHPDGRMLNLMKSRELVWIDATAEKVSAAAKEIELEVSTIKKGTYAFVTSDEATMSAWLTMSAGTHVPEDTIYKLVKAAAENLERVRAIHPMLKQMDSKMMIKKPSVLDYHSGAAKYYRERGWIK